MELRIIHLPLVDGNVSDVVIENLNSGMNRGGMFQGGDGPLQGPCGEFDSHSLQWRRMMEFGDNRFKRITRFLYRWLWCSWVHRRKRRHCNPPNFDDWHCGKCHPCGETMDILCGDKKLGWL